MPLLVIYIQLDVLSGEIFIDLYRYSHDCMIYLLIMLWSVLKNISDDRETLHPWVN